MMAENYLITDGNAALTDETSVASVASVASVGSGSLGNAHDDDASFDHVTTGAGHTPATNVDSQIFEECPDATNESNPASLASSQSSQSSQSSLLPDSEDPLPIIDPVKDLAQKRDLIRGLLDAPATEGDVWFLVSNVYLTRVLTEPASSFDELKSKVGPVDCSAIVDQHGALYPIDNEPIGTYNIPPSCFHQLTDWFGKSGVPVARSLIINPDTGAKEVERYPPYFVVHTLIKNNSPRSHTFGNNNYNNHPHGVSLSQTKTFTDLIELVQVKLFKAPSRSVKFRVWFIDSPSIEEIPANVTVAQFIQDIPKKTLVHQSIFNQTLKSQGIGSARLHLLVESLDKSLHVFPVDSYLANFNQQKLDWDHTMTSGGNLGLANLGNTCYMNSALQCLLHVPEINYYFFYNLFEQDLNKSNPLGNKGDVAVTFGSLLHKLFGNGNSSQTYVAPREFKSTIGRYSSLFQGYQQQDSQEFLSWLLDALHEDLNRIYDKPYSEKPELKDEDVDNPQAIVDLSETCWHQHKQRNDSIIVDLFTGMYQSTLICPDCSKKSITFDPFNDLTLPLPINKKWYHTFTVIDLTPNAPQPIMKLEVELNKTSNYDELLKYLSKFLKVSPETLFLFELFRNFFYKDFQESYERLKFYPISEVISDGDDVLVYVIPHDPEADIIVPVFNTVPDSDKTYNLTEPFGLPLFVVLDKKFEVNSFGKIRSKLEQVVKLLTKSNMEEQYNGLKVVPPENSKYYSSKDFPLLASKKHIEDDVVMVGEESGKSPKKESDESSNPATDNDIHDCRDDYDDGYDSDISLANPMIGGNFGFEIKYHYEDSTKPTYGRGYNRYTNLAGDDASKRNLRIPRGRPQFNNLPSLAVQLPELKRNYYHYPEYSSELDKEIQEMADEVDENLEKERGVTEDQDATSQDSNKTSDDFVLVEREKNPDNNIDSPPIKIPSSTSQQSSDEDADTESESNLGNVGSLFDSVYTLGPPSAYPESERQSIQNSPGAPEPKIDNHPVLVDANVTLVCEWDPQVYELFFKDSALQNWQNLEYIPNPELEANKATLARHLKSTVSLYDCLKSFSTPEVLGDHDLWYCPRCKDHKQATKTIQIWSTGDLLTIHLKRFQSARSFSDKIDVTVDFPIEGLDMAPFVASKNIQDNSADGDVPFSVEKNDMIYDLIAVDNHYGGLGGGHYTASAKNFRDNNWYYFNDGRVTKLDDPAECITGAAYLLFYRKRTASNVVGGESVEALLRKGRAIYEQQLNDTKKNLSLVKGQVDIYNEFEDEKQKSDNEQPNKLITSTGTSELESPGNPELPGGASPSSIRKTRSLVSEDEDKSEFDEQTQNFSKRKQRLISKDEHNNKSVHINNISSSSNNALSSSTVASPAGSSSSEEPLPL